MAKITKIKINGKVYEITSGSHEVIENGEVCLKVGDTLVPESKLIKLLDMAKPTISGAWMIKSYPTDGTLINYSTPPFTYDGVTYNSISIREDGGDLFLYFGETHVSYWETNLPVTIDFGETPQKVSDEFWEFMKNNAGLLKTAKFYNAYEWCTFSFFEGMTWKDFVNDAVLMSLYANNGGLGRFIIQSNGYNDYVYNNSLGNDRHVYTMGKDEWIDEMATPLTTPTDVIVSGYNYGLYD